MCFLCISVVCCHMCVALLHKGPCRMAKHWGYFAAAAAAAAAAVVVVAVLFEALSCLSLCLFS